MVRLKLGKREKFALSSRVSVLCNGCIACRLYDECAGSYHNNMAVFLGQ